MAVSEYILFGDIDEFVVPHGDQMFSLHDVVEHLHRSGQCALQFLSAFFEPTQTPARDSRSKYDDWGQLVVPLHDSTDLLSMTVLKRSREFSRVRTKCLVRPYQIFEAGIHHISKPIWASLVVQRVETSVAFLHHYRNCVGNLGMSCAGAVEDTAMLRYKEQLERRVNESLRHRDDVVL